jgi:predicted dithiol-disulfide oxidoreductase (DUF899 family)
LLEIELRRQIEAVATRRRALPPGGDVPQHYLFEPISKNVMPEKVEMSKLFGRHHHANPLQLYVWAGTRGAVPHVHAPA